VPVRVPCDGAEAIVNVSESPSGSLPVSVIGLEASSLASTVWSFALGWWLPAAFFFSTTSNSRSLQAENWLTTRSVPRRLPAQSFRSFFAGGRTRAWESGYLGALHLPGPDTTKSIPTTACLWAGGASFLAWAS
jgi:hypothetical protein